MRKPIWIAAVLICVVVLIGGWIIFSLFHAPNVPVFQTENITRITFHTHRPPFGEYEVPAEYMGEITAWLDSFEILSKADPIDIPAGANGVAVEVEYTDGTVIYHGLDYPTIDDVTYRVRHDDYPACFDKILEINN
jgi:hypothetical protein